MKVAILISGQPRNFDQGYKELQNAYLSKYDCDIYIHTWKGNEFTATQFFPNRPVNKYELNDDWESKIRLLYKPELFEVTDHWYKRKQDEGVIDTLWRQPLVNTKGMFGSMWAVSKLMEKSGKQYDACVRARFDLKFEQSTLDLEKLDLSKVNVWDWDVADNIKSMGTYDVFSVTNQTNMMMYSAVYPRIQWYLEYDQDYKQYIRQSPFNETVGLRNEYLLKYHLETSGLELQIHNNTIKHADGHIIR